MPIHIEQKTGFNQLMAFMDAERKALDEIQGYIVQRQHSLGEFRGASFYGGMCKSLHFIDVQEPMRIVYVLGGEWKEKDGDYIGRLPLAFECWVRIVKAEPDAKPMSLDEKLRAWKTGMGSEVAA